ncbi:hypothetical protein F4680DRAFT_454421 [Xylaria scruposa]|nr:hypothetical protein F4680DRAFT_454421 [Xylaria scruposa]
MSLPGVYQFCVTMLRIVMILPGSPYLEFFYLLSTLQSSSGHLNIPTSSRVKQKNPTMARTKLSTMVKENAKFDSQNRQVHKGESIVYVVVGAMSAVGAKLLERLLMASYHSAVFYVLWDPSKSSLTYRQRLFNALLNNGCKLNFIKADDSRMADIDFATNQIIAAEDKVDYICMSKNDTCRGEATVITSEGVKTEAAVWYASRMRLIANLLPLLGRSQQPRVLNILNHGIHKHTDEEYKTHKAIMQYTSIMTNLAFNHLAMENQHITFILSPLGFDGTGYAQETDETVTAGVFQKAWRAIPDKYRHVSQKVFGSKPDKILERHLYYLTADSHESGAFHVDARGEIVPNARPSEDEDENRPKDAWEFASKEWHLALAKEVADQPSL